MSAGTLTVHQLLNVLTDLDALALQVTTDTSTIYVDDLVSPAVRIVFEHDPAAPGFATSFAIEGSDGTPLYAASDYGVSLAAFQALVTAQDFEAALALLLVDLGTLALAEEADASLISLKDGLVIEGNDENTLFEVAHEATTVNAGDGDDVIVLRTTNRDGYFNGGEGNDTLWLDTSLGAVDVSLGDNTVMATVGFEAYFQRFESIEFFRGSIGSERFTGVGSGMRFEGGDGEDQFLLWSDSPTLVDIVTYADAGGDSGIVVNLGFDPLDLSAMDDLLEAALAAILAGSDAPWMDFVRDTFGKLDYMSTGLLVEGSEWDDFFYGSAVEDGFVGGSGADHFFGGDGDDEFDGGADQDTFYLSGGFDDYAVTYDAGTDVFTIAADDGSGTDSVTGVEAFSFGGDVKTAAELKPVVVDSPPVATNDDNDADAVIEAAGSDGGDASAQGDVIENDLDADSDAITVIGIRAGAEADAGSFLAVGATREIDGTYGTLTIALNGTWSYVLNNSKAATNTLPAGTTAYDVFTYQISAGGETDEATLTIAVGGRNDAPVAGADSLGTQEDTPLTIDASLLAGNDADPEGDAITVIAVQGATNGTVALSAGKVTFTPAPGFHGTAGFNYTLQDALGAAVTQQVSVAVGSVNDAPQANSDTGLVTNEDQPLTIMAATLLANDSDPDGDVLTIASVSSDAGGAVVLNADGTISFTPTADFNGQARFSYRVKDGAGALSMPATATIAVAPVNDAPSFTGVGPLAAATVLENTTFVAALSALDIDSAALTFSLGGADAGAFAIEGNTLRFAAPADFEAPTDSDGNGVYQVSVTVSDGALSETRNVAVFVLDGAGNTIAGTNAADRVDAGNGVGGKTATGEEDVVDGKGGKDTLSGAAGDDVLLGGKGDDRLNGDAGDDMLRGGAGRDRLDGGAGIDTADLSDATKAVVVTLNGAHQTRARVGGAADDTLKNIENVTGGKRADTLTGDRAANVLVGNGGNDVLAGALGADTLSGGAGRDRFVFDTKLSALNVDTIGDFKHNGDRIVLDAGVFKAIGSSLSASEFRAGAGVVTAFDRGDRIIYDTQTGALYYDRDGSKSGAAINFATLTGAPAIDAGDFLIV